MGGSAPQDAQEAHLLNTPRWIKVHEQECRAGPKFGGFEILAPLPFRLRKGFFSNYTNCQKKVFVMQFIPLFILWKVYLKFFNFGKVFEILEFFEKLELRFP